MCFIKSDAVVDVSRALSASSLSCKNFCGCQRGYVKTITAEEIHRVQQGAGKRNMKLKMRGNASEPDFKLHTGAFALLLSYAKLKNNCSVDVSGSLEKRFSGTRRSAICFLLLGLETFSKKIVFDLYEEKYYTRKEV